MTIGFLRIVIGSSTMLAGASEKSTKICSRICVFDRFPSLIPYEPTIERRSRPSSLIMALLFFGGLARSAEAQQSVIHYVYDDLGRLVGAVDQDGNATTYTYNAVVNILAVHPATTSGRIIVRTG